LSALPFEFVAQIGASHTIWHETAGVWLERQPDLRLSIDPAVPEGVIYKDPVVRHHPSSP
jgi:hypothetical protein